MKQVYNCPRCRSDISEVRVVNKVISIKYNIQDSKFTSVRSIKCPICNELMTVLFDTFDCSKVS